MSGNVQETIGDGIDEGKAHLNGLRSGAQKAASNVAKEVKHIARAQAEKQIDHLADQLTALSKALRSASSSVSSGKETSGIYGERIIDGVSQIAKSLKQHELEQIVQDTESYARARPAAYLIAAVAVGFITARFLKNMSPAGQTHKAA
jgi:light-regulated signal transduction histidine kinase (bacteriophytochrome)